MSPPVTPRPKGLLFIFLTVLLDVMGLGLLIPVIPTLIGSLLPGQASAAAFFYGLLISLYTLMQFLFAPLLGALSDQHGRKPLLLISLAASALAYLAMPFAPSIGWLLATRVASGIGGASLTVASAYLADISAPETRAQNFGLLGAAFGLGFILGPAIGGALGSWNVQAPFYAAALLAALNFAYGLWVLPESHPMAHRKAFSWRQANPLGWMALIRRHPLVLRLTLTLVLANLAQQCVQSTWVPFTQHRFGWSPAQTGASLAVAGLMGVIVNGGLIRVLLPKLGERRAILGGLALCALAMLGYGLITEGWMMYAIIIGTSVGAIAGPATQGLISRQVGPDEQGAMQGALTGLMSASGIVAPLLANSLFAHFTAPQAPIQLPGIAFFLGAALASLALVSAARVLRPQPAAVGAVASAAPGA